MSFAEKWPKLHLELPVEQRPDFTTFRYFYWQAGWLVQVFYKSRSANREKLGEALILKAEPRELDKWVADKGLNNYPLTTDSEAKEDGFAGLKGMVEFMKKQYGLDWMPVMNKLTLRWVRRD